MYAPSVNIDAGTLVFVLMVATVVPFERSLAGNAIIAFLEVGELVLLTKNKVPSSLLCATALSVTPVPFGPTVTVVTDAVGAVLSITMFLFAPREPAAPGVASVSVASSLAAFFIVTPAETASAVVEA